MLDWIYNILQIEGRSDSDTVMLHVSKFDVAQFGITAYLPSNTYSIPVQYSFYTVVPLQSLSIHTPSHLQLLNIEKPKYPLREGWNSIIHYLSLEGNLAIAPRAPPFNSLYSKKFLLKKSIIQKKEV